MAIVKGIPYGVAKFEEVRNEGLYYVDKTMYLPLLEETGNFLFLIRPRRFGKSLFVTMMQCYYDSALSDRFDILFDDLWIKAHPTPGRNAYQLIYFDFSKANLGRGTLEENLDEYIAIVLDGFINRYADSYSLEFVREVRAAESAGKKLKLIDREAHMKGYPLYLIIDEYDNFTNVILSEQGKDVFKNLTHASGFYREYFKMFKAMFSRVFLIGVSPVTLDDLSSGYNIDWNISQDPRFNAMLGFSDSDVRTMFQYYKTQGKLRPDADIEAMIEEMRPWYNNYCFAKQCLSEERLFNCDMVLYYLRNQVLYGIRPDDMVDKNVRTDYSKLKMLAEIDQGAKREQRMSVIEEIAATGEVKMNLRTSFPAEYIADEDNFRSLIYYYGMLTMGSMDWGELKMVIPNNCVREQYWGFMRRFYGRFAEMDFSSLRTYMKSMAKDGDWRPFIEMYCQGIP